MMDALTSNPDSHVGNVGVCLHRFVLTHRRNRLLAGVQRHSF